MTRKCICGSAIVAKGDKLLFLWHEKLEVWLYPGGHNEEGETPQETAVRETLEETGMLIKIIDPYGKKEKMKDNGAQEMPLPLRIIYEHVAYKTEPHEHFDMVYLAALQSSEEEKNFGTGESKEMRWVAESEIDSLKTYPNVKWVSHVAFSALRN